MSEKSDKLPKYELISEDVRLKILSGVYPKGSQLPLETEMCASYGVSRITVKRAIDQLVQEGFVVKRRGSGTFVKDYDVYDEERTIPNRLMGFTEMHRNEKVSTDVLCFDIIHPDAEVCRRLNLTQDDFVYHFERIRKVQRTPACYEISYIPLNLVLGLTIGDIADSVYHKVEQSLGIRIQSGHKEIYADTATDQVAEALGLEQHSPVLCIDQVCFLESGQQLEYSHYFYPPARYRYYSIDVR